jgi:L-asparaginase/Glu-tRNA(Gln) amidotransferase subunit D
MAFALRGTKIPIVLSGAQIAVDALGSDAGQNVVNACRVAALRRRVNGREAPALPRVVVVFGSQIIDGTRCRKMSENDLDAFASINAPALGTIRREIELHPPREVRSIRSNRSKRTSGPAGAHLAFDDRVALLQLYPAMRPDVMDAIAARASGLVIAAFGAGNIPSSSAGFDNPLSLEAAVRRAVDCGVPVVVTTQCPRGLAESGLYDTGARARAAGAIVADDMTTEAAFVKLSWLLSMPDYDYRRREKESATARARRMRAIARAMLTPVAGEIRQTNPD